MFLRLFQILFIIFHPLLIVFYTALCCVQQIVSYFANCVKFFSLHHSLLMYFIVSYSAFYCGLKLFHILTIVSNSVHYIILNLCTVLFPLSAFYCGLQIVSYFSYCFKFCSLLYEWNIDFQMWIALKIL